MEQIIYLLSHYKYLLLFPLAIVEGPILAVIAGLLCTCGYLNPLMVFPIIVSGDITGDSLCYLLGRWGMPKFLRNFGNRLGLSEERLYRVRTYFDSNPTKTISLSKITLGIGVAGIYLAGHARIPYPKFLQVCLVTSFLQYVIYLSIGLLFGGAYMEINHYLNYFATIIILSALAAILFFFIKSKIKKP